MGEAAPLGGARQDMAALAVVGVQRVVQPRDHAG